MLSFVLVRGKVMLMLFSLQPLISMTSCCYFEHASFCFHSVHQLLSDCLIVSGINSMKPYLFLHLLVMGKQFPCSSPVIFRILQDT